MFDARIAREHRIKKEITMGPNLLERIQVNPGIFGGKPNIRGMRMAVEHVLGMLAAGDTPAKILEEYPLLQSDDIQACLLFAYRSLAGEQVHERVAVGEDS
jgi:uncharacterized protein (DUF433 family)